MPEPKKQSSPRKTGLRRSHLRLKLARAVNKKSPVKAFETAKKTPNLKVKTCKCTGKKGCKCKDCTCKKEEKK
ncbi:hypothetical protein IJK16_01275 [Candidatus Saccharibacteria bacterium]|jgi:hypothetical protein|nr:hypothetical protein [Candidatus Saccharibacteria bacterium]